MIEQIKVKVSPYTPIPSETTVLYSFAPRNTFAASSQRYTCRLGIKHSIQRRQLRAYHIDAHYCNAIRKYSKEMASRFPDTTMYISYDDKAKIDFGEPGHVLSTGVRGKMGIAPTSTTIVAEDHDTNRKGTITPSVILDVNIPCNSFDSFYRGQVTAILKDSVFQQSTSFRTVLELIHYIEEDVPITRWEHIKTLIIFTDGGSEHRVNYESVKIALVLLFKRLKSLNLLVAFRTAPGQSYANFVERIMSILNIGLQNVALERYGFT